MIIPVDEIQIGDVLRYSDCEVIVRTKPEIKSGTVHDFYAYKCEVTHTMGRYTGEVADDFVISEEVDCVDRVTPYSQDDFTQWIKTERIPPSKVITPHRMIN